MEPPVLYPVELLLAWLAERRHVAIPCIASLEDGTICRAPATRIDHQRRGMVCALHAPEVPLASPAPAPTWGPRRPVETHRLLSTCLPSEET